MTAFQKFTRSLLVLLFAMGCDKILDLNTITANSGQIKNCWVSSEVQYMYDTPQYIVIRWFLLWKRET